ncbi:MAG: anthranilate synthase component I [Candidatus Omnitrophica bacterium]|nr:anthranilate synthase component I [Candidatus Omnitrophota bacterium]
MYTMTEKDFLANCTKGNLVPVYREIPGDLETPVAAYMKLARNSRYSFLLESVEGGEKLARYSFIARDPECVIRSKGREIEILSLQKGRLTAQKAGFERTPLEIIRQLLNKYNFVNISGLPQFCGGFVGYLSYDMVRFFEKLPDNAGDDLALPDMVMMLAREMVIFDHLHHTVKLVSCVELGPKDNKAVKLQKFAAAMKAIKRLETDIAAALPRRKKSPAAAKFSFTANCSRPRYEQMVLKAKEEIRKGEIIQVVLSRRIEVSARVDRLDLYRTLRALNPSPYMYLLSLDELAVVGSSPEMLVRCEHGLVETRPIAGTRPRGKSPEEDAALEKELLADPKEIAEHVMLVDLGRNDLGRVCREGTVKVNDLMSIEKYSHVMHIVSNVQGQLKPGQDAIAALEAVFPAGTLSGAPKIRAMEIIDGLEAARRGPYGGCVGYFSFSGDLDMCITIRTVLLTKNKAYIQCGAGIVADSDPAREYAETMNKAGAQLKALELSIKR